jgi:hypothetical protein
LEKVMMIILKKIIKATVISRNTIVCTTCYKHTCISLDKDFTSDEEDEEEDDGI